MVGTRIGELAYHPLTPSVTKGGNKGRRSTDALGTSRS